MRIIFVRHGHPDYEKNCLTEIGHKQAEAAAQGAEEDRIGMTGFSQNTTFQNGLPVTTATYTFNVDGVSYAITCHPGEDGWAVCGECTGFD